MSSSTFAILSNSAPLGHESFAAHRELESLLKKSVRGEVRFDSGSRALYAADASNYRQLPIGVIFPRDAADVEATLAACRATDAAVLPRGAGTSLAGQCVNVAVVIDYSRYMNALASIDPEARLARVEPGIVLDRLRDAAELHQLTYAPDPATHSRCTLGGMIGNNSCGVHGLLGGKVVDNVESLDVVLYDGTRMTVGATPPERLEALIREGGPCRANLFGPRAHPRSLRSAGPRKISSHSSPRLRLQPRRAASREQFSMSHARWSALREPALTLSPPR
ncbi:MAG: FAD-binding oxidoreductase [Terracidiphilus sp.]